MESLNMNNNYKPEKKKVDANGNPVASSSSKKLFADPKYNKLFIAVGIVLALLIIAAIVFINVPTETFVK